MPLSENEQRILDEIENHLHTSDPRLAREVGKTRADAPVVGSIRWSVAGLLVGLGIVLATLQIHFLLAFVGFVVMLVSMIGLERQLRSIGRSSLDQVTTAIRSANPSIRRDPPADGPSDQA